METKLTIAEKAYNDLMWYLVHYDHKDGFSFRALRGCSFGIWVAATFSVRWIIHKFRIQMLDLRKLPISIREKLRPRSVIKFDELPPYSYEQLRGVQEIRLLVLHPGHTFDDISCDLKVTSLANHTQYNALSYVWGDESILFKVRCGKDVIQVRENLFTALRRFRG
jgi:hypothetical protein